jgi:hypothetical protein
VRERFDRFVDATVGVVRPRSALSGLLAVGLLAGSFGLITAFVDTRPSEVLGGPGTTWLSAEKEGRVVLAAAGGERATIAREAVPDGAAAVLDVVDLGERVVVLQHGPTVLRLLSGFDGEPEADTGGIELEVADPAGVLLVDAGTAAYVVDAPGQRAVLVPADGPVSDWVDLPQPVSAAVGAPQGASGALWTVDRAGGSYAKLVGTAVAVDSRGSLGQDHDLELTAVGELAAVLDRTDGRLRFLSGGTPALDVGLEEAILQQPVRDGECVQVLVEASIRCVGPRGELRRMPFTTPIPDSAVLVANDHDGAVMSPGSTTVTVFDWDTQATDSFIRSDPSPRTPRVWSTQGPLLVDDPGSQYAFSVTGGRFVELNKIDVRTPVYTESGVDEGGSGPVVVPGGDPTNGQGGIAPGVEPGSDATQFQDSPGRNDPPIALDDQAVTRPGRTVTIDALANDVDPDGDTLLIVSASPLGQGVDPGAVNVIEGGLVSFAPDEAGTVRLTYTISDPGGGTDSAVITVRVRSGSENDPPSAEDDTAQTTAGRSVEVPVLTNDRDPDGDPLVILPDQLTQGTRGLAASTGSGTIRYEPRPGPIVEPVTDTFTYVVDDGYGGQDTATVTVTIVPDTDANQPPTAEPDRTTAAVGTRKQVAVLANDTDPENDPLTVVGVTAPPEVVATVVGGQVVDLDPRAEGLFTLTYTIEDAVGNQATGELAVLVEPATLENRPPVAIDDQVELVSGRSRVASLLGNDSDPDGDLLVIRDLVRLSEGDAEVSAVQVSPTSVRFSAATATSGLAAFRYTIADAEGVTARAEVRIFVVADPERGPVAVPDSVTAFPGDTVTVKVLANDFHPDGLPFSLAGQPTVREGQASVQADGSITFTPGSNAIKTYVLTYTIADPFDRRSSADVTISVVEKPRVNQPPIARDDQYSTPAGRAIEMPVTSNDADPEGGRLVIKEVKQPSSGRVTISSSGQRLRFDPGRFAGGTATFTYTVADPEGATATGKVSVTVLEEEKPPVAVDDAYDVEIRTTRTVSPLTNDLDPDGTAADLELVSVSTTSSAISVERDGRNVKITGIALTGSTPATFSYVIRDVQGRTATGRASVTVSPPPNRPPVAVGDSFQAVATQASDLAVLNNDTDPDGGQLTLVRVGSATPAGAVTSREGNVVRFRADLPGVYTFSYEVSDPQDLRATGTATVTVSDCPITLNPDVATVVAGQTTTIDVLANDTGFRRQDATLTARAPDIGTATVTADKTISYAAPLTASGRTSITYDVVLACARKSATVDVTIQAPNRAPVASPDQGTMVDSTTDTFNVLANDSDPDGDRLEASITQQPAVGTATVLANNRIRLTVPEGTNATVVVGYRVTDPGGLRSESTLTVVVSSTPPTTPPPTTPPPTTPPPTTPPPTTPPPTTPPPTTPPPTTPPPTTPPPTTEPPPVTAASMGPFVLLDGALVAAVMGRVRRIGRRRRRHVS